MADPTEMFDDVVGPLEDDPDQTCVQVYVHPAWKRKLAGIVGSLKASGISGASMRKLVERALTNEYGPIEAKEG